MNRKTFLATIAALFAAPFAIKSNQERDAKICIEVGHQLIKVGARIKGYDLQLVNKK